MGVNGSQSPILTVTLNPALDLSSATAELLAEIKLRCESPKVEPGGGGINVSRGIARMGGQSTAMVALGGLTGQRIATLLAEAGIATLPLPIAGETRESFSIHDRTSGAQYRFVLPGPAWSADEIEAALTLIAAGAADRGYVVLSGSNPPGVAPDFVQQLAARLQGSGAQLIVDTSGPALACLAAGDCGPVAFLRMDSEEAEGLAGGPLPTRADTADFARTLVRKGAAKSVLIARGRDGNIIATADEAWHAEAERVEIVSKIGAGDSFVAGFTLGLAQGLPLPEALGLAAAAATATVQMPGSEQGEAEAVGAYYDRRIVTRI